MKEWDAGMFHHCSHVAHPPRFVGILARASDRPAATSQELAAAEGAAVAAAARLLCRRMARPAQMLLWVEGDEEDQVEDADVNRT